jgi:hypothetical protein
VPGEVSSALDPTGETILGLGEEESWTTLIDNQLYHEKYSTTNATIIFNNDYKEETTSICELLRYTSLHMQLPSKSEYLHFK